MARAGPAASSSRTRRSSSSSTSRPCARTRSGVVAAALQLVARRAVDDQGRALEHRQLAAGAQRVVLAAVRLQDGLRPDAAERPVAALVLGHVQLAVVDAVRQAVVVAEAVDERALGP